MRGRVGAGRVVALTAALCGVLVLGSSSASAAAVAQVSAAVAPTPLIIDTDLFSDADQVLGLATGFALQGMGEDRVIAITLDMPTYGNSLDPRSWGCAAAVAQFYNSGSVPIGADMPDNVQQSGSYFVAQCAALAPPSTPAPDNALDVLRQALVSQPDGSVVIAAVGYEENLRALLNSPPDGISPLDGHDLTAQKVKELVVMGGGYPSGGENNFQGSPTAAADVAANWPTKVVYSGYEVGNQVLTGNLLDSTQPSNSPVRVSFDDYAAGVGYPHGAPIKTWNPTAIYHAVRLSDPLLTEVGPGQNAVDASTGNNTFTLGTGDQFYLNLASSDVSTLDSSLNTLLDLPPGAAPPPVPVDETLPTIAGSTVQGQTLTDGSGSWSNSPTGYLYQWQRCDSTGSNCSSIANANGPTYALTAAELGATIRMVETAFNTGYGLPATSAQTAVVSSPPPPPPSPLPLSLPPPSTSPVPVDLSVPTIAGQPAQSRTLTESHGAWSNSPIGYLYQWERCNGAGNGCSPITGVTGPRYQLNAADVGSSIRVVETASNSAGLGSPATSSATLVVKPAPPKTSAIHAQINPANHRATFRFAAKGHSTGFQCALVLQPTRAGRKAPLPRYLACGPKKTFTHLAAGRYVLYVRAVGPGGVDKTPVRYTFTIS